MARVKNNKFNKIYISTPNRNVCNLITYIPLKDVMDQGWFITEIFNNDIWLVRESSTAIDKHFSRRCEKIKFECDRTKAEKIIMEYAEKQYNKYKDCLLGTNES